MRIALAFNLKRVKPESGGIRDDEAEYDGPVTLGAIREALASLGHEVIDLEADRSFPRALLAATPDLVFNVAEGARGRSREAHVPALLELLGIPYTGSDPASMVLTLDKAVAKAVVREAGVPTPRSVVMTSGDEPLPAGFALPAIVKPVAEGSSKGVLSASVATSETHLRTLAHEMAKRYAQGALVEEYLPGREFTVAVLGDPAVALPPMEVVFREGLALPVYSFDHKLEANDEVRYEAPARVSAELDRELRSLALRAFAALGCRDVGRVDLRLDRDGNPSFIECNPLPGLTPGWSDLCLIAEAAGLDYRALIARILEPALVRARAGTPRAAVSAPSALAR